MALCADLTGSVKMDGFQAAFPDRFFEIGIAEQNLVTVAAGLAVQGKIPFTASYAAFSPGRNWEQIKRLHVSTKFLSKLSVLTQGYTLAQTAQHTRCLRTLPSCVPCLVWS